MSKAYLVLANGTVMQGESLGAEGTAIGEVVFNTGVVGYEENLTDPANFGQLLAQTYPLVGNYGMNGMYAESARVWVNGYIVRESCDYPSNFRCEGGLEAFLKENNVVAIQGIDTRRLTRILRNEGVMNGAVTTEYTEENREELLAKVREFAVCGAVQATGRTEAETLNAGGKYRVAVVDYGCKRSVIANLVKRGCEVALLGAFADAGAVKAANADAVLLAGGPGRPDENEALAQNARGILELGLPVFGIGLGHQIAALAAGAKCEKLKFGHRGANQPVTDLLTGRTLITSQNHGYAVAGDTLPAEMGKVSHVNANDGSCEGIVYTAWNCFTVQFEPTANGGPQNPEALFDEFIRRIAQAKGEC